MKISVKAFLITTTLFLATTALAAESTAELQPLAPNLARIILKMIDAHGNIVSAGHVTNMEWVWSRAAPTDAMDSPALRIWIKTNFPEQWRVEKVTGNAVTLAVPFQPGADQILAIDLRAITGSLRMSFRDQRNKETETTLAVQMTVSRPYVLLRPECALQNVHVLVNKSESRHLFVGLSCVDIGDGVDVYFFRSTDGKWDNETPGLLRFDPEGKFAAFKHHFGKPKRDMNIPRGLFDVGTVDAQGRQSAYSIYFKSTNKLAPRRYDLHVGIAGAIRHIKDRSREVALTQYALNASFGADYQLVPEILFATLGANIDFLTNLRAPSDLPTAEFGLLDGLLGYRLPLGLGFADFTVFAGWNFWQMYVANDRYGISHRSGQEAMLTMGHVKNGQRGWLTWFKFAMIGDHVTVFNTTDQELGLGVLLELADHASHPFALTAEMTDARAQTHAHQTGVPEFTQFEALSFLLGIRKEF